MLLVSGYNRKVFKAKLRRKAMGAVENRVDERRWKRVDLSERQKDYIVFLPFEMNYSGVGRIPRLSLTRAETPDKAVMDVLSRIIPKEKVERFFVEYDCYLNDLGYEGVRSIAYKVPNIDISEIEKDRGEFMRLFRKEVSNVRKRGSPDDYAFFVETVVEWYLDQKEKDRIRLEDMQK